MDDQELLAKQYGWVDEIAREIRDAEQARTSAEHLQRQRASVIAAKRQDFWNGVKFAAERAAERLGEHYHFESLSDNSDSFVIRRASIASLTGTISGDAITMICTRAESAGKLHSDPPVRFFIHVDLDNKLYLKQLDEKMTVYDALKKMLRAAFVPR